MDNKLPVELKVFIPPLQGRTIAELADQIKKEGAKIESEGSKIIKAYAYLVVMLAGK
jgi:hypothetical protein